MTNVYVTRTGAKYHAIYLCPGVVDAEMERGHDIDRWQVPLDGLSQEPCARCWPESHQWNSWTQLAHQVERFGDSPYEVHFVNQVLQHVRGLTPSDVSIQRKAEGRSGATYILDFVLETAGGDRVAVEIDGTDKAPGDRTIEQVQRRVDVRRADLRAAGWRVLNLSNGRVVNHSAECITEVESELQDTARPQGHGVSPLASVQSSTQDQAVTTPLARSSAKKWSAVAAGAALISVVTWFALVQSNGDAAGGPGGQDCPAEAPIKGNVTGSEARIYHRPGWRYYDVTRPEECFATPQNARDAGYRESNVQ